MVCQLLKLMNEQYGRTIGEGTIRKDSKKDERKSVGVICTCRDQTCYIKNNLKGIKFNNFSQKRDDRLIINTLHINICTEAEGPHRRMAIWFQGCNILCDGCCNPELQEIKVAHIMTVQEVIDIALMSKKENEIGGVTFLGGEPTLQEGLIHLAEALSLNGLRTILFTGKSYECLDVPVRDAMDLIIDGNFDLQQLDEERNLVGSKNQRIICVTDRYRDSRDWFLLTREKRVEINFNKKMVCL